MALPKLTIPTYMLVVPSTKKKVKFRPFLSKEEKVLMLVKQSQDPQEILQAMKDIVDVCTFEKLNVAELALFDLEYIFLQLRSKSIGEVIEIDMKCNNEVKVPAIPAGAVGGDVPVTEENNHQVRACGALIPFNIDISDIKLSVPKEHTKVIKLEKEIGMTMRYPSITDIDMLEKYKNDDVEIIRCLIESVYDKDNVYDVADISEEDLQEFVDNISSKQIENIRKVFFYKMPVLSHKVKYTCPKCGFAGEYEFSGINDFF